MNDTKILEKIRELIKGSKKIKFGLVEYDVNEDDTTQFTNDSFPAVVIVPFSSNDENLTMGTTRLSENNIVYDLVVWEQGPKVTSKVLDATCEIRNIINSNPTLDGLVVEAKASTVENVEVDLPNNEGHAIQNITVQDIYRIGGQNNV